MSSSSSKAYLIFPRGARARARRARSFGGSFVCSSRGEEGGGAAWQGRGRAARPRHLCATRACERHDASGRGGESPSESPSGGRVVLSEEASTGLEGAGRRRKLLTGSRSSRRPRPRAAAASASPWRAPRSAAHRGEFAFMVEVRSHSRARSRGHIRGRGEVAFDRRTDRHRQRGADASSRERAREGRATASRSHDPPARAITAVTGCDEPREREKSERESAHRAARKKGKAQIKPRKGAWRTFAHDLDTIRSRPRLRSSCWAEPEAEAEAEAEAAAVENEAGARDAELEVAPCQWTGRANRPAVPPQMAGRVRTAPHRARPARAPGNICAAVVVEGCAWTLWWKAKFVGDTELMTTSVTPTDHAVTRPLCRDTLVDARSRRQHGSSLDARRAGGDALLRCGRRRRRRGRHRDDGRSRRHRDGRRRLLRELRRGHRGRLLVIRGRLVRRRAVVASRAARSTPATRGTTPAVRRFGGAAIAFAPDPSSDAHPVRVSRVARLRARCPPPPPFRSPPAAAAPPPAPPPLPRRRGVVVVCRDTAGAARTRCGETASSKRSQARTAAALRPTLAPLAPTLGPRAGWARRR